MGPLSTWLLRIKIFRWRWCKPQKKTQWKNIGRKNVVFHSWFGCWSWVSCSFGESQIHSMQRPFWVGLSPGPGLNLTMLLIPFLDLRNHPQQLAQSWRSEILGRYSYNWITYLCFYLTIHIYHQLIMRVIDCYATIRSMQRFFVWKNIPAAFLATCSSDHPCPNHVEPLPFSEPCTYGQMAKSLRHHRRPVSGGFGPPPWRASSARLSQAVQRVNLISFSPGISRVATKQVDVDFFGNRWIYI